MCVLRACVCLCVCLCVCGFPYERTDEVAQDLLAADGVGHLFERGKVCVCVCVFKDLSLSDMLTHTHT